MIPCLIPAASFSYARIQVNALSGTRYILAANSSGTMPHDDLLSYQRTRKWQIAAALIPGVRRDVYCGLVLNENAPEEDIKLFLEVTDQNIVGDHTAVSYASVSPSLKYATSRGLLVAGPDGSKASPDGAYTWNDAGHRGLTTAPVQPGDGTLVFCSQDGRVLRSSDWCQSVVDVTPSFGIAVSLLAVDARDSQRWIVGLANGTVSQTMSGGFAWTDPASPSTIGGQPTSLPLGAVSCSANPNQTLAAQDSTLWASSDGWANAQAIMQAGSPITALDAGASISLGLEDGSVMTSRGQAWLLAGSAIVQIARPPMRTVDWLYTAGRSGEITMLLSDGSWELRGGLPGEILSLSVDQASPIVLWAGTSLGAYVSPDAGLTWLQLAAPAGALGVQAVGAVRPVEA